MNRKDTKILEKKTINTGYIKVERYKIQHKLFSGKWSEPFDRELSVRPNAVGILPYDPKLDKVVLIEQFRIGALKDKNSPWLLEVVAGIIDKDKSPEEIAKLEAKEEAGLEITDLTHIMNYWTSPGGSSEYISLYCAIVNANNAKGIHGLSEEHEDILVHVMNSKEAFDAVKSGRINNAVTIIALQWLELQKKNERNL